MKVRKKYKITYSTWYGDNYDFEYAENKTNARRQFVGSHNADCKILIIKEVEE